MTSNFETRVNRSRSPASDYAKRSLLAKVDKSELAKLRVAIKRSGINAATQNIHLERSIDDPAKLCAYVHIKKGNPPRVPIFGGDIIVNQDFSEDRTVFTHEKYSRSSRRSSSRSRSRGERHRSRSRDKCCRESRRSRTRDRSRDRHKRSGERHRKKSRSRTRSTSRSPNRERKHSPGKHRYRHSSREKHRSSHRSSRSPDHHRRSITPLRPGEYRPGHPDLALRNASRTSRSRSRSPRSPRSENSKSTSRERRSTGRSRSSRALSPYSRDPRRSRSRHRSPMMSMPGMEYGFYGGFGALSPHPYRGRIPMIDPGFYPRMYPPNMMMPRMPLNPLMARMPFRPRWPIYNSGPSKPISSKPATVTGKEDEEGPKIKPIDNDSGNNEGVSSSDRQEIATATDK